MLVLSRLLHGEYDNEKTFYCHDGEPDLKWWATMVSHSLIPTAFEIFPRCRWLRSVSTLKAMGLLTMVHHLFRRLIPAWIAVNKCKKVDFKPNKAPQLSL